MEKDHFLVRVHSLFLPFFIINMSTYSKIKFFLSALLVCCIVAGCGEVRTQVTGKVTYPDGSPVTVGEVRGYGDGSHIRSDIGADGSFELFEVKPGDRVPAGKTYGISIVNAEIAEPVVVTNPGMPLPLPKTTVYVAPKFADEATSGLTLEVPKSSKPIEYNIEVTRP